jgi:hypothetical protein
MEVNKKGELIHDFGEVTKYFEVAVLGYKKSAVSIISTM